jgi:hypothetical protein
MLKANISCYNFDRKLVLLYIVQSYNIVFAIRICWNNHESNYIVYDGCQYFCHERNVSSVTSDINENDNSTTNVTDSSWAHSSFLDASTSATNASVSETSHVQSLSDLDLSAISTGTQDTSTDVVSTSKLICTVQVYKCNKSANLKGRKT